MDLLETRNEKIFRYFHLLLGITILGLYFYTFLHMEKLSPEFKKYLDSMHCYIPTGCHTGLARTFIEFVPLITAACFMMPRWLSDWLSPRTSSFGDRIFTKGVFYIAGYLLLVVTIFIYYYPLAAIIKGFS